MNDPKTPILAWTVEVQLLRDRPEMVFGTGHEEEGNSRQSEHAVGVEGLVGHRLAYVPMFDDLAVFKPEDFHDRQTQLFGLKLEVDMEDDKSTVGEGTLDSDPKSWKLLFHSHQQRAKSLDAILGSGIVVDKLWPEIGHRFVEVQPGQGRIVKSQDSPFVSLKSLVARHSLGSLCARQRLHSLRCCCRLIG